MKCSFQSVFLLSQVLPKSCDWQDFLQNESNKFRVCNLLADYFSSGELTTNKTIYVTKEQICYIKQHNIERRELPKLYSCHREADHRYNSLTRIAKLRLQTTRINTVLHKFEKWPKY